MKKRRDTIAYQVSINGVTVQIVCPQGFQAISPAHLKQMATMLLHEAIAKEIKAATAMG